MTTEEMIAYMNQQYVVRLTKTNEWITGQHVNSTNQNKAKLFNSYSEALDEKIRLSKTEYLDSEIFQTY